MSDGTLRAFGILLALFQKSAPAIVVIEEPETSLHPAAAAAIMEALRNASEDKQIIVSTHSPEILDMADAAEDELRVVTWQKGLTSIGAVEGAARESLRTHLASAGELLRMRILDAPPLFDSKVDDGQLQLFVETP